MNEEEKKAIEYLKEIQEIVLKSEDDEDIIVDCRIVGRIQILLNLIEEQQKEIKDMKKELDLDEETEIALNNRIVDLEKEIDKQNKVIKEYETLFKKQEKLEQEKDILKKQGWL